MSLHELETADVIMLIGANTRHDQPLINHRIRKAALRGAKVIVVSPVDYAFNFPVAQKLIVPPSQMTAALGGIAKHVTADSSIAAKMAQELAAFSVSGEHEMAAATLKGGAKAVVVTGNSAQRHAAYGQLCALANIIADATAATYAQLTDGANAAGGWFAGAVPHRGPAGRKPAAAGLNADRMFDDSLSAYLLLGIEPEFDCLRPQKAIEGLNDAFVVALTAFQSPSLEAVADVLLPIAVFAENEGSYINALGQWQTFAAAVRPPGEARPAWKLIRVMGERLSLPGFDAVTCADVTGDIHALCEGAVKPGGEKVGFVIGGPSPSPAAPEAVIEIPSYAGDAIVRRGEALQATLRQDLDSVYVNQQTATQLGLKGGGQAAIKAGGTASLMSVVIEDAVGDGCYVLYGAHAGATEFSGAVQIEISKA